MTVTDTEARGLHQPVGGEWLEASTFFDDLDPYTGVQRGSHPFPV
jgi:hypothetical protein